MGRVTALGGVLAVLCALLRISGTVVAGEPVERPSSDITRRTGNILAKVSSAYCDGDASLSPASVSSTSGQSASVLSAAAIQAVTTVAAAAGLTYTREVATRCWVQLGAANIDSETGLKAAINALKQPSAALSAGPVITHAFAEMFNTYALERPRNPSSADREMVTAAVQREKKVKRSSSAGPSQVAGFPNECGSGTCNSMWGMNRIRATDLWRLLGAAGKMPLPQAGFLKGMVIDDGTDYLHNDFKGQIDILNSRTFDWDGGNLPAGGLAARTKSHGTHVMGTVAGAWSPHDEQNDNRGIAGVVGPTYGNMVSCNVFGPDRGASDSDIADCIAHAINTKSHYSINLSLGAPNLRDGAVWWNDTFAPFCAAGGVASIAAGNGYEVNGVDQGRDMGDPYEDGLYYDFPQYTATFQPDCIMAVAALSPNDDTLTDFSNWGQSVRIAAPGAEILSDVNSGGNNRWASDTYQGTSMASPHVAGAVLLLRNLFPAATNKQVVRCILSSADRTVKPFRPGAIINGGVLNVLAAYYCLEASVAPPPAVLDCTSSALKTPQCLDKASGLEVPNCQPSDTEYCLPVGNKVCSYLFSTAGSNCNNQGDQGTCTGKSTECVLPPPAATACFNPPWLDDADWETACYNDNGVNVGGTCFATCLADYGYFGDGYESTCQSDGTWSRPAGSCQSDAGPQCYLNCRVANCNSCFCGQDETTGDTGCQCNQRQGFVEWSYTDQDTQRPTSSCVWDVSSTKGNRVRGRRNANLTVEYTLYAGFNKICPTTRVISKVTISPTFVACDKGSNGATLPMTAYTTMRSAGVQPLNTQRCPTIRDQGRTVLYSFKMDNPANSRGRCKNLKVSFTDNTFWTLQFRYLD